LAPAILVINDRRKKLGAEGYRKVIEPRGPLDLAMVTLFNHAATHF
jgi:hypothetical protein